MTYRMPTLVAGTNGKAIDDVVSIARPASLRVGDLLLLVVATETNAENIRILEEFTPIVDEIQQGGVNLRAWYRFATHAEPATYSVLFDAADGALYNLLIVRGVHPFSVVCDVDASQGNSTLPLSGPVIDTVDQDNCLAVAVLAMSGSGRAIAEPTDWNLVDADDVAAGSLSWAIAAKELATAGSSGVLTWSAGDMSAGDYAAITLAITPGVMGLADTVVYGPQRLLALTLADCTEFRNLVGASDHASAFARIWHESLPAPAGGAERYSLDELDDYRPYAMVFTADLEGATGMRQATGPGGWADRGVLRVQLEISTPKDLARSPILVDHFIKQTVGRIIKRPPDESSATFVGLEDLAHTTNEVDGYSYLAADQVLFRGYHRSALVDQPKQGDCLYAWLEIRYGEGGV